MSSGEEDGGGTPLQDEPEYGYQLEEAQPPGGTQPFSIGRSHFEDEEEEEEGEIADEEENELPAHRRESYTGEDQEEDSEGQLSGEEADDGDVQQRDEESMEDQGSDDDGEIQDSDNDNANMDESNQYPQPEEEEDGDGEIDSPMAEEQEGADIRSPSPEGSQEGEEVRSPSPMSDQSDDDQGPASPAGSDHQSPGGEESQGPASPSQGSAHSPSEDGGDRMDNMEVQNQDSQQSSRMSDFESGETTGDNQKNSEYDSAQDSQLDSVAWSETMVEENRSEYVPNQPPFSTHSAVVSEGPQSPSAQGNWSSVDSYQGPQSPSNSNQGPQSPSNSDQGPQSPDDGSRGPISPSNSNQGPQSPSFQDEVSQDSVNKDGPTSPSSSNQGPQSPPGFQGDAAEGPASPVEKPEEGPASPSSDAEGPRSPSNKDEESRDGSEAERRRGEDEEAKAGSGDEGKKSEAGSEDEKDTKEERHNVSLDKEGSEKGSDEEDSDKESNVGELIADIFGSSDEEEEFEGFQDADMETPKKKKVAVISDDEGENEAPAEGEGDASAALPQLSDDDEGVEDGDKGNFVSDFDLMLERKKEEMRKRRRKRKDFDIINDNDDLIAALINQMKTAAEEDRALNNQSKPAIKKLRMLPEVLQQLRKSDLQGAFLDCGILPALTEWLAPLPDKSLPHLQIREGLLRILQGFPPISSEALKSSGLGKAVMYLYKHPREIRENHERAGKLINEWSRPIFNLTSNYKNLSKEEREQRDYEQLPKKRRISSEGGKTPRRDIDKALAGDQKALRPGDKGWVQRARVPMPSNKDYVVRPHSNLDSDAPRKSSGKKDMSRLEKHMRNFQERKKQNKSQRAVGISIEGRNMSL
ncbi:protein IWS1 homolog [Lingula anatina]|uniref:Protein IWS1 homolog n=1 Tax=Lingula anatina TaxID=7574 RepID=A0A1S3HRR8_LINAN|nr:protein IWS1 homolog [Lingula anatina]|eukprot:XP_013388241.1 protein IWS1 homolog [Lingula anatina]